MELGLTLKQTQTLSPQMMQAMEILQMGSQELLEYIEETLQENPVLDSEEHREEPEDVSLLRRKLEWLESTDVQNRAYHQQDAEEGRDPLDMNGSNPMEESLYYYLKSQVRFEQLDPAVGRVADYLMESLDSNGWLDEPEADVAVRLGVKPAVVTEALKVLQSLEPAGVGARTLAECLRLQLERRGETGLAMTIVDRYLEAMSRGPLPSDRQGDRGQPHPGAGGLPAHPVPQSTARYGLFRPGAPALHHPRLGGGQF